MTKNSYLVYSQRNKEWMVEHAVYIKKSFGDDTIKILLKKRWWDWPIDKVISNIALLMDKPTEFIKKHNV